MRRKMPEKSEQNEVNLNDPGFPAKIKKIEDEGLKFSETEIVSHLSTNKPELSNKNVELKLIEKKDIE